MKVALVTGASGGIGSAISKKFIENGYFVVGTYFNGEERINKFINQLKQEDKSEYFIPYRLDLENSKEIEKLCEYVIKNFKHVDAIINNAGIDLYKLINETTESEWDRVFNVNVKSAFLITKNLLKSMIERKEGKILFISSVWGETGASMETVYSASKASLIGLTKALAKEVAPSNVNVNCICPGVIDTPMNDCFNAEEKLDIINNIPLSRFGTSKEIAELAYFLSSDSANYITGQIITVDGGFTL